MTRTRACPARALQAVHAYIEDVLHSRVGQPLSVFQEMDWVAHRARNELRAAIELMVRQQRDLLVLKLHGIVRRYEKERKREQKAERQNEKAVSPSLPEP